MLVAASPAAAGWSAPVDVATTGQDAANPQVAVDRSGNAVAVWQRSNGSNLVVQAATKPQGGTWSAPVDLSAAGEDAVNPQVALDHGNAVAVWQRSNGSNLVVQAAAKPQGGTWSAPVDLSAAGQDATNPQVAVDRDGNAVAVWQRSNGSNLIVQAATEPEGGAWSAPVDLSATGQDATNAQVATDREGHAVAAWQRSNGSNVIVQAATKTKHGVWSAPADLSATGQDAANPQVTVVQDLRAVAVWQRSNGSNLIVQAASRHGAGAWYAPVDLSATGQDATNPQVATNREGQVVAVWQRSNGSNLIVQAATKPGGGAWSAPVDLSATGQDAASPQVALDGDQNAVAVWQRSNGSNLIVQAAIEPEHAAWSAPVDLSATGQNAANPQVGLIRGENAIAVWQRSNGSNVVIQTGLFR